MLKFIRSLFQPKRRANLEPLVRQVIEQCLADVCNLVQGRLQSMSLSEARGYVRARSTQIVLQQARLAIANSPEVDYSQLAKVSRQVSELLVVQVLRRTKTGGARIHTFRQAA